MYCSALMGGTHVAVSQGVSAMSLKSALTTEGTVAVSQGVSAISLKTALPTDGTEKMNVLVGATATLSCPGLNLKASHISLKWWFTQKSFPCRYETGQPPICESNAQLDSNMSLVLVNINHTHEGTYYCEWREDKGPKNTCERVLLVSDDLATPPPDEKNPWNQRDNLPATDYRRTLEPDQTNTTAANTSSTTTSDSYYITGGGVVGGLVVVVVVVVAVKTRLLKKKKKTVEDNSDPTANGRLLTDRDSPLENNLHTEETPL